MVLEKAEQATAANGGNREFAKGRNKEKGDYISDRILKGKP